MYVYFRDDFHFKIMMASVKITPFMCWKKKRFIKIVVLPVTVHVRRFCRVTCYIILRSPTNYVNYDHSNAR